MEGTILIEGKGCRTPTGSKTISIRPKIKKYKVRKRRILIPGILIGALIIAGQAYGGDMDDEKLIADGAGASVTVDVSKDARPAKALNAGKRNTTLNTTSTSAIGATYEAAAGPYTVSFFAGDCALDTGSIRIRNGEKYDALPTPEKEGYQFLGWYTARTGGVYVAPGNTARLTKDTTLYARWQRTEDTVDNSATGVSVLMYHWFYDPQRGDPPPEELLNNWMQVAQFREEISFLKEGGFYFPTWDEVYAYVQGAIDLPEKSVVVTIDDGRSNFYKYAVPLLEYYEIPATGFIIAHKVDREKVEKYSSDIISLQSHTFDMHDGTGKKGLIQLLPHDDAVADLTSAAAVLGATDALAYPFGYYDDNAVAVCRDAGIRMAFGVSGGKVLPGMDPLRLPRVRVSSSQSAESFKSMMGG